MFSQIFFGLLLGWGVAIPVGPLSLELIRRNLNISTYSGLAMGIGSAFGDATFALLIGWGASTILAQKLVLKCVGIMGSLLLAWFAYRALTTQPHAQAPAGGGRAVYYPLWRHALEGYALTVFNPFSVFFWISVSAPVAIFMYHSKAVVFLVSLGVFLAALSWIIVLNGFLHLTRHRISRKGIRLLNTIGALILFGYAIYAFWKAVI